MVLALPNTLQFRSEVRLGSLNVASMEGGRVEVVEMIQRRRLQEPRWKADRPRRLVGAYKLLHARGDGRSHCVRTIVSEEISKQT